MEVPKTIKIEDFSRFPGGRFKKDGPHSGEEFREIVLEPLMEEGCAVLVDLRSARVVIPSFMDEAFGPIVERLGAEAFRERVKVLVRPDTDMQFNFDETVRLRASKR